MEKDMHGWNMTELIVFVLQKTKGDPYGALIELCNPVIYNSIKNRYIRGFDRDDFLQEARGVLFKEVNKYKFETDLRFTQYYSNRLNNHLNMMIRRETALKRRGSKEASSLDALYESNGYEYNYTHSYGANPEENLIAREIVNEVVSLFSDFEKRVFNLYLYDLSYGEIAKRLSCKKSQVQNAVYRCGMKFRKLMSDAESSNGQEA